ncbi:MAG: protein-disulfide reductase DsbD [Pseudomonadales bacterium]
MRTGLLMLFCSALLFKPVGLLAQTAFSPNPDADSRTAFTDDSNALLAKEAFLLVEQAYILNVEFAAADPGKQQLQLNWQIAEGYYLYRHGFSFKLMDGDNVIATNVQIPNGLEKNDDYFGRVEVYYHNAEILLGAIPQTSNLSLTVTSQGCADAGLCYPPYSQYFQLDSSQLTVTETATPATHNDVKNPPTKTTPANFGSLPYMLLLAVLGGVMLNLMPCVFPILSLKVLGFANDKNHSPVIHGATYSAGVVVSFVAVAAVLVSLQAAGEAIGWGFHLQSPWFVAGLAYLFFVMGLSLSGFVEFGGQMMNIGGKLAEKSGYSGSFFTGILATVVASPCTAPFMGTALGFAITQPTPIALLVFATLGFGMALPVLLLSCSPKLLNKIPKPGPWMKQLKQFLAFPLYATAVWLCWVVGNQTGVNGMAGLLLGCVLLALAIWLWNGRTVKRTVAAICTAVAIAVLSSPLLKSAPPGLDGNQQWVAYSPETLHQLRQQGKPVFINITADWCITCLANEKIALSSDRFTQALSDAGMIYMKGDWTNHDPEITALLRQYGRNGIPLYLAYPADLNSPEIILPQILTTDRVIDAITTVTQTRELAENTQL